MPDFKHPQQSTFIGIAYMLSGTILFSIADATGKWLTADYPIIQIAWIRSILGLLFIGIFAFLTGRLQQLKTRRPGWHLFRSIISSATILAIFYGLKYIPIAEYVSITFSAPFILAIVSPWILGEKVTPKTWIAICIGFTGILIILRPTPDHYHHAHLASLFVAFAIAALGASARYLVNTESALALNFYIYPVNIIITVYWAVAGWVSPNVFDWLLFLWLGLTATAALGCFVQSVRYAMPAAVMPIDYTRMIWMTLLGYLVWQEIPPLITWIGIIIIIISGIYVVSHGKEIADLEMTQETKTGAL